MMSIMSGEEISIVLCRFCVSTGTVVVAVVALYGLGGKELQSLLFVNPLGPTQNGCHFADAIFKCFFVNENVAVLVEFEKFVPKGFSWQ